MHGHEEELIAILALALAGDRAILSNGEHEEVLLKLVVQFWSFGLMSLLWGSFFTFWCVLSLPLTLLRFSQIFFFFKKKKTKHARVTIPSKGFPEEQPEHSAFETVHDLEFRAPTNQT